MVFADIEEFSGVGTEVGVGILDCAGCFVAKEGDTFDESMLVLLFEGVIEGFVGDLKEILGLFDQCLALRG